MGRKCRGDRAYDDVNVSNIYVRTCRWVYPQEHSERLAFIMVEVRGIIDVLVRSYCVIEAIS